MDQTFFGAVGWRDDRVEVQRSRFIGCDAQSFSYWSVDPALGDWRIDLAPGLADDSASDGASVALSVAGRLVLIHTNGTVTYLPPSTGGALGKLQATTYGGYVFVGTTRLSRLSPKLDRVTSVALPTGYALAAPTSDPDRFILALASEAARIPWGLTKEPYHAYLWTVGTAHPTLLANSVSSIEPSGTWLAYVMLSTGDERAVGRGGALQRVRLPAPWLYRSGDDREYLDLADPNSEAAQTITLRSTATGRALATVVASPSYAIWHGASAAFVPRSDQPAQDLVVLSPGSTLLVPLP